MRDTPVIIEGANAGMLFDGVDLAKPAQGTKYPRDRRTGERVRYLDIVTAFDIETSAIQVSEDPRDLHSVMYIWQWQFGERYTVIGRTWDEFIALVNDINRYLENQHARLMVYVHNLSYEFQFISGIWNFDESDVFATSLRDPLYCFMGRIELRCSYRLSGYNLATWARNLAVDHQKLTGDLDYNKAFRPWSELTPDELQYCINDVIAVVECVEREMESYGDTLYSIPYTQTGYIRRRIKRANRDWSARALPEMQNPLYVYDRLRAAFRGGDTHANRYYVESIVDVYSYDRSSSYPDVIVHKKFPMTKFREETADWPSFVKAIESGRAVLAKIAFYGIKLADETTGNPYLPFAKCAEPGYTRPIGAKLDNGRILSADYCEIAITDIDYQILENQYDWEGVRVLWLMTARYGYLPTPLISVVIDLYKAKTKLKGVPGRELEYMHAKQNLNSIYGMMCQRVIANPIVYRNGYWFPGEFTRKDPDGNRVKITREEAYNDAINRAYLNYAWAVWVTAHARYELFRGVQIATKGLPIAFVYSDTDSVKSRINPDFTEYNREKMRDALDSGAWAEDPQGVRHYMGVYEFEGYIDAFVTLGAKRYCCQYEHKGETILEITVAGVPKRAGSEELKRKGGIAAFADGFVFSESGKTGAYYNDDDDFIIIEDGHEIHITRNVVIADTTYNLSLMGDYRELIESLQDYIDRRQYSDYNKKW